MTDDFTQSPKWEQNKLFGTLSAVVAHLEEWGASGVMVQRADLEAWRDERDALHAALRDVCAAAVHTDWTMRGTPHYCAVCDGMEDIDGTTVHADDCPVAADRALLEARA